MKQQGAGCTCRHAYDCGIFAIIVHGSPRATAHVSTPTDCRYAAQAREGCTASTESPSGASCGGWRSIRRRQQPEAALPYSLTHTATTTAHYSVLSSLPVASPWS